MATLLQRETFSTSRFMDFFSEKELAAQCGHVRFDWPLVVVKELIDNALDLATGHGAAGKQTRAERVRSSTPC